MKYISACTMFFLAVSTSYCLDEKVLNEFIGSEYTSNQGYPLLLKICDEAGGRLAGSVGNEKAKDIIISELKKLGIDAVEEKFSIPCWERGDDTLTLVSPFRKIIRVYALGYTDTFPATTAEVVYGKSGYEDELKDVKGKFVLIESEKVATGREVLPRMKATELAAKAGAIGIIFGNPKDGGIVQIGTGSFKGTPCPIPAVTTTKEDAKMLIRQIEDGLKPQICLEIKSKCTGNKEISNIIATFPGKNPQKIVACGHYDSWDISTGALDNGYGTAALFDIARLIKKYSPENYYTVEIVWMNAEEFGIFGSYDYAKKHNKEVLAVVNMDMPGVPTGINEMGYTEFNKLAKEFLASLKGYYFEKGVYDAPWVNGDHVPLEMYGVPSITFSGFLEPERVWYHDYPDTADKISLRAITETAIIQGLFTLELANAKDFQFKRYTDKEMAEHYKKYKFENRLRNQGQWIFGDK